MMMRFAGLAAVLGCLVSLGAPGVSAARFQRLYYSQDVQDLTGVLLKEDDSSCWILRPDGHVACLAKNSIRVLAETPLEDADMLLRLGYGSRALDLYESTLQAATNEARRQKVEDHMRRAAGDLKSASALFRLADRFPNDAEVQYQLGRAYLRARQFEQASDAMKKAASLDLDRMDYRVGLAEARLRLGQQALLGGDPDRALSILADVPWSASVSADVRWLARKDFIARLSSGEGKARVRYDPYLFVGRYLVDHSMHRLAGPYLLAASETHPSDPAVHNYLAHVFLYLGREKAAGREMVLGNDNPADHPPFPERIKKLIELRDGYKAMRDYLAKHRPETEAERKRRNMEVLTRHMQEEAQKQKQKSAERLPKPGEVIIE